MNIERGFKRIALILSLVVGIGAWYSVSREKFDYWDVMRYQRQDYLAKKKIIESLWGVWDRGGFEGGQGKKMSQRDVVEHLLTDWSRNEFEVEKKWIWISASEFFPGVSQRMLSMTPAQLEAAAQAAKVDACFIADPESPLANRSRPMLMGLSIAFGIPAGTGGFVGVWLSFVLLRWIGCGFFTTTEESPRKGNQDELQSSPEELPGSMDSKLCACDTSEGVAGGAKRPMTVR